MRGLRIARRAYLDIDEIAEFIRRDNPARAASFVGEIAAKIERVGDHPLGYPDRSDWKPGLRSAVLGRYLILFRCSADTVEILRVLHGARDISRLLEDD